MAKKKSLLSYLPKNYPKIKLPKIPKFKVTKPKPLPKFRKIRRFK